MVIISLFPHIQSFLGIAIDNHLTWKVHINNITAKLSKGVGILLRLSYEFSDEISIIIYNILILPYLTYCCAIWGFTYYAYINKLMPIKNVIRIIAHLPAYSNSPLIFLNLKILDIFQLIEFHSLIFMFQPLNNALPSTFEHKFLKDNDYHSYDTRNNDSLRITFFKLAISKNTMFEHGTKIWNNLSPEIKSVKNENKSIKLMKNYLINRTWLSFYFCIILSFMMFIVLNTFDQKVIHNYMQVDCMASLINFV